jgi:hypothetical protein
MRSSMEIWNMVYVGVLSVFKEYNFYIYIYIDIAPYTLTEP